MTKALMLYAGSATIILWGIAHVIIPTKAISAGFGPLSDDNKRILTMEWIMEGVTLCFIGLLVTSVTWLHELSDPAAVTTYRACAAMLIVMATVSFFTGAKTSIIPMKLCPPIFTTVAVLFWLGSVP